LPILQKYICYLNFNKYRKEERTYYGSGTVDRIASKLKRERLRLFKRAAQQKQDKYGISS